MSKVVIVTGGGRGIGAATAKLLGAKGYAVCVNYLANSERADEVADCIVREGGRAFSYQADVSREDDVIRLFDAAEERFGKVTHLVNNAGVLFTQSKLVDIDLERFNKVLNSNVISCFLCSREAVRRFPPGSAIVNVSSLASQTGSPFEYVDYAASKGAMDALTKGLSREVAGSGIRVNAVRPGFIYTDMHADGGEPGRVDRLAPQIPMQRGGSAEEVANTIAWLLSDEASDVTGSFIDVAGGR
nr:SDR family oxidoreductase [uncultured Halomonas sp.]